MTPNSQEDKTIVKVSVDGEDKPLVLTPQDDNPVSRLFYSFAYYFFLAHIFVTILPLVELTISYQGIVLPGFYAFCFA